MSRGRPAVTTQLGPGRIKRKCVVTRWQKGKGGGSRTMATRCCHRWLRGFVVMCSCQSGQCLLVVVEHYKPILTLTLESFVFEYLCTLHSLLESSFACTLPASFFASSKVSVVRIRPVSSLCHHSNIYSFNIRLLHCTNHPSNDPFVSQHNLHRICSRPSSDR